MLRQLALRLSQGVYVITRSGTFLDANPACLDLLGVPSLEALRALDARSLFADPAERDAEVASLDREGEVRDRELHLVRPDGESRTVLDTCYATLDPARGEPIYHGLLLDITSRKALEAQLREQGVRDPLTGCHNRRWIEALDERFQRGGEAAWGCIFVDIDHFKGYNDRFGHHEGDAILIRMSRFLMRQVRADEAVVRVGGDEFVLILQGADLATTERIARRMQTSALTGAPVAFSLGWAAREGTETLEKTIDRADQKLLAVRVIDRGERDLRVG